MTPSRRILLMLGRFGDITNMLPFVYHEHQQGRRPIVCVAQEFESILDGVSYCERIVFPGIYNDPPAALRWIKANRPRDEIVICQAYRHPFDQAKITGSWQTESWRVARALEQFGRHPTIFDQRDPTREYILASQYDDTKKLILVSVESVSSALPQAKIVLARLEEEYGLTHHVVNISKIRAQKPYDLLALFDRAECLVTIDTFPLHLSRASACPVVALLNDGFFGSVPPPTAYRVIRYADCRVSIEPVLEAVREIVGNISQHRHIVHACDTYGGTDRHLRAKMTWFKAAGAEDVIDGTKTFEYKPRLKELLKPALDLCEFDSDVILWSNSDVSFAADSFRNFRLNAGLWGAVSMRRTEPDQAKPHLGREVFAFRADWLADHLDDIPDFNLAAPAFDLVLAAMIRVERGIQTTLDNLAVDFWPCDLPPGLAAHEPHPSSWAGEHEHTLPENKWNLDLARKWCQGNMPSLRL